MWRDSVPDRVTHFSPGTGLTACVFLVLRCLALTPQIRLQVETRADDHQAHICTLDFLPNSRTKQQDRRPSVRSCLFFSRSKLSEILPSKTIPGWLCLSPDARKGGERADQKRVRPKLHARSARKRDGWHAVAWTRGRARGPGKAWQRDWPNRPAGAEVGSVRGERRCTVRVPSCGDPKPRWPRATDPCQACLGLGHGFRRRGPSREGIATWRCSGCHRGAEVNGKSGDERNKYF